HEIQKDYSVNVYPTYLFFSPTGEIVHKDIGAKKMDDFIQIVGDAMDEHKQYFTLLKNYQNGRRDFEAMPYLADKAKSFFEKKISDFIANDYIQNYLETLPIEELF